MMRLNYRFIIELGDNITEFVNHLVYILNYLFETIGSRLRIFPLQE